MASSHHRSVSIATATDHASDVSHDYRTSSSSSPSYVSTSQRFSSNNPFRFRRHTSTISSVNPSTEKSLNHLSHNAEQQLPPKPSHHYNCLSRRRQSARHPSVSSRSPTASDSSEPSGASRRSPEMSTLAANSTHQQCSSQPLTKSSPPRRMTVSSVDPFCHAHITATSISPIGNATTYGFPRHELHDVGDDGICSERAFKTPISFDGLQNSISAKSSSAADRMNADIPSVSSRPSAYDGFTVQESFGTHANSARLATAPSGGTTALARRPRTVSSPTFRTKALTQQCTSYSVDNHGVTSRSSRASMVRRQSLTQTSNASSISGSRQRLRPGSIFLGEKYREEGGGHSMRRCPSLLKRKSGGATRILPGVDNHTRPLSHQKDQRSNLVPDLPIGGHTSFRNQKAMSTMLPYASSCCVCHTHRLSLSHQDQRRRNSYSHTKGNLKFGNTTVEDAPRSPRGNGKHAPTCSACMSFVPPRHTGLGARTISPTDVRKIKRITQKTMSTNSASIIKSTIPPTNVLTPPSHRDSCPMRPPHTAPDRTNATSSNKTSLSSPTPGGTSTLGPALRPKSSASPSMIPRRSAATPFIATRTTPDLKRKGSSSASCTGHGLGIGTGYSLDGQNNNVGGSTCGLASTPLKSAAAASSSRLPTMKSSIYATGQGRIRTAGDAGVVGLNAGNGKTALTATDDNADVPPVPAIPKVYGSPHISTFDRRTQSPVASPIAGASAINGGPPVPSARKACLPAEAHLNEVAASESTPDYASPISKEKQRRNHQHHHGQSGFSLNADCKQFTLTTPKRAHENTRLQPLNLPPLNIAPLSYSITSHVDAMKPAAVGDVTNTAADNLAAEQMPVTTPPSRAYPRTPTTPMTASKATFFSINKDVKPKAPHSVEQERRTTSSVHFGVLSNRRLGPGSAGSEDHIVEMADDDTIEPSTAIVGQIDMSDTGPDISDFQCLPESPSTESASEEKGLPTPTPISSESSLPRPLGNGFPCMSSGSGESLHWNTTAEEKGNVATGFGGTTPIAEFVTTNVSNYGFNPISSTSAVVPSATPNSTGSIKAFPTEFKRSPAVAKQRATSLQIKRRSAGAALLTNEATQSDASLRAPSMGMPPPSAHTNDSPVETHRAPPPRAALAASQGRPPDAGFRSFSTGKIRAADHALVRDNLAADEEMRRLGSKRKDFEIQARVLDDLCRRASPKDRASVPLAIRFADLNVFERGEIVDFKEIYFTGAPKAKKIAGDLHTSAANFGYDDERGDYNIVIGDHLAFRYEVVDVLGKGSFGQVVRCIDHKSGLLVAVKIIRNKKRFHQQALVEVNLLAKLKEWDPNRRHGVVNFTQSFYWRGHLCISTELLGINLYELIKAHDFKGFSLRIIRRFVSQILSTLLLLRQHKVIHCDLKPENILLVHPLKSEIKVIDFGSSCFENEKVYTYIQSRFYRSPEVILGMPYGMPIDMWSLGCIMAELYTGNPIFPGANEQEQLACIMEIFGPPERHLIERSSRRKLFFDSNGKPRTIVSSKGKRRRPSSKDLKQALKCDNDVFLDFIARCLRWDPNRRLNPVDALNHEFITGVKAPPRPRHYGSSSSVRRVLNMRPPFTPPSNTVSGPSKASTSAINSTAVPSSASRSTHISSSSKFSPAAGDTTRRQSNIGRTGNSSSATTGTRGRRLKTHTSSSSLIGSSLPRVSQRSVSTKADLATAAAATSLPS